MGQLVSLQDHRIGAAGSARRPPSSTELAFDLADPYCYLAIERAERLFPDLTWVPVLLPGRLQGHRPTHLFRAEAERRADELGMPLIWPDPCRAVVPGAMRAAAWAAEQGRGGAFATAAARLAFCGGYDIEAADVLREAAEAAGLDVAGVIAAARDRRRDTPLLNRGQRLWDSGVRQVPTVATMGRFFCGEGRLNEASVAARVPRRAAAGG